MACWQLKYVMLYIGDISIFMHICQNTENLNVLWTDPEIVMRRDPMIISASGRRDDLGGVEVVSKILVCNPTPYCKEKLRVKQKEVKEKQKALDVVNLRMATI